MTILVPLFILLLFALFLVYVWEDLTMLIEDIQGEADLDRLWADDACTCDPVFFPDALDADCPVHGLAVLVRRKEMAS